MEELKGIKIGFIGYGNMGRALVCGLIKKNAPCTISVHDSDPDKARDLPDNIKFYSQLKEICDTSDILVFAVKPDVLLSVLTSSSKIIRNQLIISIAAGIQIKKIKKILSSSPVIRVMPNTPALAGKGMSVLSPSDEVTPLMLSKAETLFKTAGKTAVLPEKLMDAVTGLSGSGPAFVYTFIQALADGGVKMGIPRNTSLELAAQTVLGSAAMVLEQKSNPIDLRDRVTSPGGTTIEGVHVLESSGFSGIVMEAVQKAAEKSKKLGETE